MANTFRIETILVKDLYDFCREYSSQAKAQQISPISQHRADSQSKNPCAERDDIGLLVAYVGDLCVGYQGLMPGRLRTTNGMAKVYWGTASYVLPEFRKRMVAVQLVRKLISLRKDIIVTHFNKPLADLFLGLHFQEIKPLEYVRIRFTGLDVLSYPFKRFYRFQKRWPLLRKTSEGVVGFSRRSFYPIIRSRYHGMLLRRSEKALHNVEWQELAPGKLLPDDFRGPAGAAPLFERDASVVNWMIEYPWINDNGAVTKPPYFFGESYLFRFITLLLDGANGEKRGFVVLSRVKENVESKLKVLDFSCAQEDYGNLFWLVCYYAARFQVDEIELPLRLESYATSLPFAWLLIKKESRRYVCSPYSQDSPLGAALDHVTLNLTDGDSPFT